MEIIVILSCPLWLQEEHKDPFIPDQDNYRIHEWTGNKSCPKDKDFHNDSFGATIVSWTFLYSVVILVGK